MPPTCPRSSSRTRRIQGVVSDLIGRFPAALRRPRGTGRRSNRRAATATRSPPRTSGSSRPGCERRRRGRRPAADRGHPADHPGRTRLVARERPATGCAGYAGVWAWDHFMGRGDLTVPVVANWTILAMAAATTSRITVAPFVINAMNRHPAVLARHGLDSFVTRVAGDRPWARIAPGIRRSMPPTASISRMRPSGSPASRNRWRCCGPCGPVARSPGNRPSIRWSRPTPDLSPSRRPRSSSAGRRRPGLDWPRGSRTAGRRSRIRSLDRLPIYLEALEEAGRRREDQRVYVGFEGEWLSDENLVGSPWVEAPRDTWEHWREAGADGAIILARTTADVDLLVEAAQRW